MHVRRGSRPIVVAAAGLMVCAAPASAAGGLSEKAARQISALQQIKGSLSAPERKLDSRLAVALREKKDRSATAGAPRAATGVKVTKAGTTEVDIRVDKVDAGLLKRLAAVGATVRHASKAWNSIRAGIPLSALT